MKPPLNLMKLIDMRPNRWIFGGLIAVTLYFQTNLGDPFNSPKSWILLIVAAWLTGYLLSSKYLISSSTPIKRMFYIILMFNAFTLASTIFTDVKYFAIFGETQRRNGFLSYLALSVIMLGASFFIRVYNIKKLYMVSFFVGVISVTYALLQTTGNDFVKWNNPYNAVIGTMGNPNFAAAVMAIIGVMTFASLFINAFNLAYRISASLIVILLLFSIYRSNARQGLLAYILGVGVFLTIFIWTKNKKFGILSFSSGLVVFIFSVMGMLQMGPLEKYLYKTSVTIRGYYWNAGIEMLIHHPFFGVGMDRYGDYFKQYRKMTYPLNYGFEITSTNAHNTFIHLFATGGLFLGLTYLVLNGYVLRRAYVGIRNLEGNNRIFLTGLFSAWVAFHAQSLISIDNVGISVWGWVLGGSIVGLSILDSTNANARENYNKKRQRDMEFSRIFVSGLMTMLALILVSILYRGESNSYNAALALNSQDNGIRTYYKNLQDKVITGTLTDPNYKLFAASNLVTNGFIEEGISEAKEIYKSNNRSQDALTLLALTSEQLNKMSEAIIYREKIALLDPWNAANFLALGKDFKSQGNLIKSKEMLDKILSFASAHQIATQAKIDLAP